MRVLVAMSGGVDSSVVACLLKEQGHEVTGALFHLWQDPLAPSIAQILPSKCCTTQTRTRATAVAKRLGIPLLHVDLSKEFKNDVVDPFLASCRKGLTPNPCVTCNPLLKFSKLFALADSLGCEKIATGHYARIKESRAAKGRIIFSLLEARDGKKDQSYFLYRLTQEQLSRSLFPLGSITKEKTYELAERFRVPLDAVTYRESQDLCFFPEKSPSAFLRRYIKSDPGPITTLQGEVLGTHEGLPFYTVGQRRGLKVGGQTFPLYVIRKEQKTNSLVLASYRDTLKSTVIITKLSFPGSSLPKKRKIPVTARIRALGVKRKGVFIHDGKTGKCVFLRPLPFVTPGQSLVLYKGRKILGGGMIQT